MIITDLIRRGKSELYKTFVDGEYVCLLEAETIVKHHIKTNMEISAEDFDAFRLESENLTCKNEALKYVSCSLKTRKQVFDHFVEKGYLKQSVNNALDILEEYGYINDKYYAQMFVKTKKDSKGRMYIVSALKQKGVKDGIIEEVLEDFETDEDVVFTLANKFLRNKKIDEKTKEKLFRHLISKGFSFYEVKSVVEKVLKDK